MAKIIDKDGDKSSPDEPITSAATTTISKRDVNESESEVTVATVNATVENVTIFSSYEASDENLEFYGYVVPLRVKNLRGCLNSATQRSRFFKIYFS